MVSASAEVILHHALFFQSIFPSIIPSIFPSIFPSTYEISSWKQYSATKDYVLQNTAMFYSVIQYLTVMNG